MKIIVGIPARMGASRLPGKPMRLIDRMPLVEHCFHRAKMNKNVDLVFVATPDQEIADYIRKIGGKVIMTENNIQRPGLRVAVAAEKLNLDPNDIVIVSQGDEPLVNPEMFDEAISPLIDNHDIFVSNLCDTIGVEEWSDPNEIKVICNNEMEALYMSRSPVPSIDHEESRQDWFKQVCIMPFRWWFMQKFNNELEPTSMELQESIEMNRAIQHGYKVKMIKTKFKSKSVDTLEDLRLVEKIIKKDVFAKQYNK